MRPLLALLAAGLVLLGAGLLLFRAPAPPAGPPGGPDAGETVYRFDPGAPSPPPPAPAPAPAVPAPAPPPPPPDPDSIPGHPPPPLPEGDYGEIVRADLPAADREKVEATRLRLIEAPLGEVAWRKLSLRAVLDDIAAKSATVVEIEGEGLGDEIVPYDVTELHVLEALRSVTTRLKLRFEIRPDRVIVRR